MRSAQDRWVIGGGLTVLIIVAILLFREFFEPGQIVWNLFLAALVIALIAAAIWGQRYFRAHASEIGEARFNTTKERED